MGTEREAAWTDYWTSAPAGAGAGGCLPEALDRVGKSLQRVWREAAAKLPRGARILDLATGDGAVLKTMHAARPDLKLLGIDSAHGLPPPPKGFRVRGGVAMEALPLPDAGFHLATSQFGFEYGDTERIAIELGRVIAPAGGFRFVLHHHESPIVSHNLARREALAWAAHESGLIDRGRSLAAARQRVALPTPPSFGEAVAEARRRFPTQPVAAEFAMAVGQTLELGRRAAPAETVQSLAALAAKAGNEMNRLDALRSAACDADRMRLIVGEMAAAGFVVGGPDVIREDRGSPLAWLLVGSKI